MTARNWSFTCYQLEETASLLDIEHLKFAIWQEEVCPTTQRHHHQGYLQFKSPVRISHIKKVLKRAHLEASKGDAQANITYCTKEETRVPGTLIRFGEPTLAQGQRTDLENAVDALRKGATVAETITTQPSLLRYISGIERYAAMIQKPRKTMPEVIIIVGKTGTGKSTYVLEKLAEGVVEDVFRTDPTSRYMWEGYKQQKVLCFEDIGPDTVLRPTELLRICDRWPMKVNVKYGHAELDSQIICFTTNVKWEKWLPWEDEHKAAFQRRIKQIITL